MLLLYRCDYVDVIMSICVLFSVLLLYYGSVVVVVFGFFGWFCFRSVVVWCWCVFALCLFGGFAVGLAFCVYVCFDDVFCDWFGAAVQRLGLILSFVGLGWCVVAILLALSQGVACCLHVACMLLTLVCVCWHVIGRLSVFCGLGCGLLSVCWFGMLFGFVVLLVRLVVVWCWCVSGWRCFGCRLLFWMVSILLFLVGSAMFSQCSVRTCF